MRFGLVLPHFRHVASPEVVQQVARDCEDLGYHSIWVTDHVVLPTPYVERFGTVIYEPLMLLGYLAAATRRIVLGTSVIVVPYRNPLFLAKALATADVLSGGRLLLGVAAGWCKEEFDSLGVSFERRGDITDETLRILKAMWSSETPSFQGEFWSFRDVAVLPHPVQRPHPPLWVGGNSARARRRAVELGDGWQPTRPLPADVRQGWEHLRRLAERAGRALDGFVVSARTPLKFAPGAESRWPLIGDEDAMKRGVEAYQEAGTDTLVLDTFYSTPELHDVTADGVRRTAERFARRVMPSFV